MLNSEEKKQILLESIYVPWNLKPVENKNQFLLEHSSFDVSPQEERAQETFLFEL